jgi:hypothetical protein
MRALLGLLCLFSTAPAFAAGARCEDALRSARTEEVRGVLAEISADRPDAASRATSDLPEGLREAIEVWTKG